MAALTGRNARNPYFSGSQKWGINVQGVDVTTGNFSTSETDLSFEGGYGIPVNLTRSYSLNNPDEGPFGLGWTLSADVRTTAGGVLKSGSAPVRSIPVNFKERPTGQDMNGGALDANEPVEAVMATDAQGTESTLQRDLDGVIMGPDWDTNVNESEYANVEANNSVYRILVKNTVTTVEGTKYEYEVKGRYPNGVKDRDNASSASEPSNILKVTKATDRHGNVTTYHYETVDLMNPKSTAHPTGYDVAAHQFVRDNGVTLEARLQRVDMPGGRSLAMVWGGQFSDSTRNGQYPGPANRIVCAFDFPTASGASFESAWNGRFRTYKYGYSSAGHLASVTTPMGKVTSYGYSANDTLHTITDPRGLITKIYAYIEDRAPRLPVTEWLPTSNPIQSYAVRRIDNPNGTRAFFYLPGAGAQSGLDDPGNSPDSGQAKVVTYAPNGTGFISTTTTNYLISTPTSLTGQPTNTSFNFTPYVGTVFASAPGTLVSVAVYAGTSWEAPTYGSVNVKFFDTRNLNLVAEATTSNFIETGSVSALAGARKLLDSGIQARSQAVSLTSYNYLGAPLKKRSFEANANATVPSRNVTTEYAYWGRDKAFQQKAVRSAAKTGGTEPTASETSKWRYSYTDYYPVTGAPAGHAGQTKETYGTGLDSNHSNTFNSSSANWRSDIAPASGAIRSSYFEYDSKGRASRIDKIRSITNGTATYVRTLTEYDSGDGAPNFGNPLRVYEDATGANRLTETLQYDLAGRTLRSKDGNGRQFRTTYNLDGQISLVELFQNGSWEPLTTYTYGTSGIQNGQLVAVYELNEVTGADTSMGYSYHTTGPGIGQPNIVVEQRGALPAQATYSYNAAGERAAVEYLDRDGSSRKYVYGDYVQVGTSPGQRVFQTMQKQQKSGNNWIASPEEFHYAYDGSGRMLAATLAMNPSTTTVTDGSYYSTALPANRVRARYSYDGGGRLVNLNYIREKLNSAGTSYTVADQVPIKEFRYAYDVYGRKTLAEFWDGTNTAPTYTETYEYDSRLDYLTSAVYSDATSQNRGWRYDAAGNRTQVLNGSGSVIETSTFDGLNRILTRGSTNYTHDAVGNRLTQSGSVEYGWDAKNRMTTSTQGMTNLSYVYRPDGLRIEKVASTTWAEPEENPSGLWDENLAQNFPTWTYSYDGQMKRYEDYAYYNNGNSLRRDVTRFALGARGVDMIERQVMEAPTNIPGFTPDFNAYRSYPIYDGHGNMVAELRKDNSANGFNLVSQRRYDAWGGSRSGSGGSGSMGYCANIGHHEDPEAGLIYMRARYYEPETGRFISEDPARDGSNWLVYCENDPINLVDRSGLAGEWFGANFAGGILTLFLAWALTVSGTAPAATVTAFLVASVAFFMAALDNTKTYKSSMKSAGMAMVIGGIFSKQLTATAANMKLIQRLGGVAQVMGFAMTAYSLILLAACLDAFNAGDTND
jgi:RHS repeat-associated protein